MQQLLGKCRRFKAWKTLVIITTIIEFPVYWRMKEKANSQVARGRKKRIRSPISVDETNLSKKEVLKFVRSCYTILSTKKQFSLLWEKKFRSFTSCVDDSEKSLDQLHNSWLFMFLLKLLCGWVVKAYELISKSWRGLMMQLENNAFVYPHSVVIWKINPGKNLYRLIIDIHLPFW